MPPLPISSSPPQHSTPTLALLLIRFFNYEPDIVDEIRQCFYDQLRRRRRIWEQNKYLLKGALVWDYWLSHHMARGLSSMNLGTYIACTTSYIPILNYVLDTVNSNEPGMGIVELHDVFSNWCNDTPREGLRLFAAFLTAVCIQHSNVHHNIVQISLMEYDELWHHNLSFLTSCTESQTSA